MFEKGRQKTGGRKKGTSNKRTSAERDLIRNIVEKELKTFPRTLRQVEPTNRLLLVTKLLPYVYAKKTEISIEDEMKALLDNIQTLSVEQLSRLKEIINECLNNEESEQ